MRIKFKKGEQRRFIQEAMKKINCPSLRELINRGIEVNYSTLKNYFNEDRLIPENIFNQLIEISGLNKNSFDIKYINEHWGQTIGGKKSRKNGLAKNRTWALSTSRI